MIHVGELAPAGCWDSNMLRRLFSNELYPTGLNFRLTEGFPNTDDGAILVVPGRYWHEATDQITEAIARFDWCLGIRTADEEDLFDVSKVEHGNLRWWVQTPRVDRVYPAGSRFFGVGYTPQFNNLPPQPRDRDIPVFLSAQNTHARRQQCFEALTAAGWGYDYVQPTEGFTQGLEPNEYAGIMAAARVAPCPSGAVSPDSFRLYEALEAHCVPLADDVSPLESYDSRGYWRTIFKDPPFPIYTDTADIPGYVKDQLDAWPANANRVAAYWMRYKRSLALGLRDDLQALGAL